MRNRLTLLASLAAISFSLAAHADTSITAAGPAYNLAPGSTMPGSALDYDLFGWQGPTSTVQTNFTITPLGSVFAGGSSDGYATIAAPGSSTAYFTGLDYAANPVATFTAKSGGDFTVYILNANTDSNPNLYDNSIGLSTNGGPEVDIPFGPENQFQSLQFNEFDITGATAGETFNVYANGGQYSSIGGISFESSSPSSPSPVPEPSSLALLTTGVLSLAGAARRRFVKA